MDQLPLDSISRPRQAMRRARQRMTPRKLATIVVVALIHIGAVFGLLRAFDIDVVPQAVKDSITAISLELTQQPEPDPPVDKVEEIEPEGASGAEAAKAKPKEVSAPPVKVPKPEATKIPPAASTGDANQSGAANEGTGTGGGGPGIGTGSGGQGSGSGGIPYARRAEKIAGEIRTRDYPRSSRDEREGAYVIIHYTVGPDGRPRDCRVARSSGNAEVDQITCRLAIERFRYRPAIDGNGNPTSEKVGWKQWWWR